VVCGTPEIGDTLNFMDNPGMPFHVVLYEPEIPPNTGNIIRLCANTGASLHLIQPFGFEWEDKRLRRAGLDYRDLAHVTIYENYADFEARYAPQRLFAFTTKASQNFSETAFAREDAFIFGPETRGLPAEFLSALPANRRLRIPMHPDSRSLNLANSVAIALYEAWRQIGFIDSR
jgi:tRNA (cytidine/uridine-2'-O-)-methyltransferase